ncbi:hypothetical protein [Pseudoalteromonas ruthenica]|uniref:hypothetical protein n=1 Tax=Pseudoalteromonas ruthenica TaxID=151081 RepID=UPI00110BD28D|nr:hypothetical protein [Pseudoalteromonas ruthenica]TMO44282.1 hypothetical protein CWC24_14240 [Pseudoalteromonas ruthenica]TMO51479.1 hypothetical protein CWC23_06000 [Pseudoalteromonas ruthenica]
MHPVLNDILSTLGGIGFILSGFFVYFGKTQLERLKKKLEANNLAVKSKLEQGVHVTKSRFDREFEIYQELWASLVELKFSTLSLRPALDQVPKDKHESEIKSERLRRFSTANNNFVTLLNQYTPFFADDVNESLQGINKICRHEAVDYQYQDSMDMKYWERQQENTDKLLSEIDNCGRLIKKRVDSLSVVGDVP